MSDMVRKQIYLPRRQNIMLKQLAKRRGVSEAEVIRQALEREAQNEMPAVKDSRTAIEEIIAFALSLRDHPDMIQGKPYHWNRDEIYAEREKRWREDK